MMLYIHILFLFLSTCFRFTGNLSHIGIENVLIFIDNNICILSNFKKISLAYQITAFIILIYLKFLLTCKIPVGKNEK